MNSKFLILLVALAFSIVPFLLVGLFLLDPSPLGELSIVNEENVTSSSIPEYVREDAENLAVELCGNSPVRCNRFVDHLLKVYSAAEEKDFVLIYNSGGFGREGEEMDRDWGTIIEGAESELRTLGYSVILVQYTRTYATLWDFMKEIREMMLYYPTKARVLAAEVDFLTEHIQNLRVIVTGRSFGGMYSNEVMKLLEANPRVYSIQAGIMFFYRSFVPPRTLVMNDNGITPDSLARGDLWAIIRANFSRGLIYRAEEGHVGLYFRAPGHIYTWDHPGVRMQITSFLNDNFGSD
ncbi:MAG: hypothetical protein ACE5IE_05665 [Dehalococcoidia bacterium]